MFLTALRNERGILHIAVLKRNKFIETLHVAVSLDPAIGTIQ